MLLSTISNIVYRLSHKLKRIVLFSLCLFFSNLVLSQVNLIPNPSFEDTIQIPNSISQLSRCKNWYAASVTPDFYSTFSPPPAFGSCSVTIPNNWVGHQFPKHGNNYCGQLMQLTNTAFSPTLSTYEAIGVKLIQPLNKKYLYSFKLFYNVANYSNVGTNQLNVYFTNNQFTVSPNTYFNTLNPQVRLDTNSFMTDTMNWVPVSGVFFAKGSEQYVTIGGFKDAVHTKTTVLNTTYVGNCNTQSTEMYCYVYFDSLSLYEIPILAANCMNDTIICIGDSVQIGNNSIDTARYSWTPIAGLSCTNCANPKAKPLTTTTYYLTKQIYGTISYDTITVTVRTLTAAVAGADGNICSGQPWTLGGDNQSFFNYSWQPSTALNCTNCATPVSTPTSSITYTLTKTGCGTSTSTVSITVKPNFVQPSISLNNQVHCLTDTLNFTLLNYPNGPDILYQWQPINLVLTTPTITAMSLVQNNSYYYALVASGPNSIYCPSVKKDSIFISIPDTCNTEFVIPNVFTPNYDDINDVWRVKLPYSNTFQGLYIYNRWGTPVYILDNNAKIKNVFWDGHTTSGIECADGIYFYVLETIDAEKNKKIYKGTITLLH